MPLHHSKDIKQQAKRIKSFLSNDAPRVVGVEAKKFIQGNFKQEAFIDIPVQKWNRRRKSESSRRALLVKTGRLKRSFNYRASKGRVKVFSADVPYAQIHNEGGTIKGNQRVRSHFRTTRGKRSRVRAFDRKMNVTIPKRQFIGNSKVLDYRINKRLIKRMIKIMNT